MDLWVSKETPSQKTRPAYRWTFAQKIGLEMERSLLSGIRQESTEMRTNTYTCIAKRSADVRCLYQVGTVWEAKKPRLHPDPETRAGSSSSLDNTLALWHHQFSPWKRKFARREDKSLMGKTPRKPLRHSKYSHICYGGDNHVDVIKWPRI